jgi:hypothetical protein
MACRQCHPTPCCTVLAKAVSNSPSVLAFNTFKLKVERVDRFPHLPDQQLSTRIEWIY